MYLWHLDTSKTDKLTSKGAQGLNRTKVKIDDVDEKITIKELKKFLKDEKPFQYFNHIKRKKQDLEETVVELVDDDILKSGQTFSKHERIMNPR